MSIQDEQDLAALKAAGRVVRLVLADRHPGALAREEERGGEEKLFHS